MANRTGEPFEFNAALIYLDVNDDGGFDPADGDVSIQDYFVLSENGTETHTGFLAPSASPYRVFFFGNPSAAVTDNGGSFSASADYTGSFSLSPVPEPTCAAMVGLLGVGLLRHRR